MKINTKENPLTLSYQTAIAAPVARVWKTISTPSILEHCHPFCKENPVKEWPGVGAKDRIIYHSEVILDRHFLRWTENSGYQLVIGRGDTAAATVDWTITKMDTDGSMLKIAIYAYPSVALRRYPKILYPILQRFYFAPLMRQYVASVVKGFQYHIETGKDVQRNQFGKNRMFSA